MSTVSTLPFVAAAAAAFTAFAVTNSTANSTTRTSSPSRSISPAPTSVSRTHSPAHHRDNNTDNSTMDRDEAQREAEVIVRSRNADQQPRRLDSSEDGISGRNRIGNSNHGNAATSASERDDRARSSSHRRARASAARETASSSSSTVFSVIYDIACCDGPVRFHRVLNENYSSATSSHGSGAQTRPPQRNCQLTAESEDPLSENDENGGPATRRRGSVLACSPSNDSSNDGSNNTNNSGCYTCGYCKHTFKSQYCYRKHAKRHLLPPTRINETTSNNSDDRLRQEVAVAAATSVAAAAAAARGNKREVRLLDLNVQYYPCKICGCKFPSYYFVHKHRKLCHANDEERQAAVDGTNATSRDANASSSPQDAP